MERVPILDAGKKVAVATWPYVPLKHEEARKALACLLASGGALPADGVLNLTIAIQVIESGGIGLQVVEASSQTQTPTSLRQAEFRAWALATAKYIPPETLKKWGLGDTKE